MKITNEVDNTAKLKQDDALRRVLQKYTYYGMQYRSYLKELQELDLCVDEGPWKKAEIEQLKENWNQFRSSHQEITDPEKLLVPFMYPSEEKELKKKRTETVFIESLSTNLKRFRGLVYEKAQALFIEWRKGKFSPEELSTLKTMRSKGCKWKEIAFELNRNPRYIRITYYHFFGTEGCKRGKWDKKEDKKLLRLTKEFTVQDDLTKRNHPSWAEISKIMKRNPNQCCKRYYGVLAWKERTGFENRPPFSTKDKIDLIIAVYEEDACSESDVDWIKIAKAFSNVPNASFIRSKWLGLRNQFVPRYNLKTFRENCEYLMEEELPRLQQRLARKLEKLQKKNELPKKEDKAILSQTDVDITNGQSKLHRKKAEKRKLEAGEENLEEPIILKKPKKSKKYEENRFMGSYKPLHVQQERQSECHSDVNVNWEERSVKNQKKKKLDRGDRKAKKKKIKPEKTDSQQTIITKKKVTRKRCSESVEDSQKKKKKREKESKSTILASITKFPTEQNHQTNEQTQSQRHRIYVKPFDSQRPIDQFNSDGLKRRSEKTIFTETKPCKGKQKKKKKERNGEKH